MSENSLQEEILEELNKPVFRIIKKGAEKHNIKCFVIGGYVRDFLLKRPSSDIDIVVEGSGIALAEEIAKEINTTASVFKNFGTAMVRCGNFDVEFVGARKESYRRESRKPIVENGTIEDDQQRRDFTINALAFSLNKEDFGKIIDPFGGIADLAKGIIRTPLNPDITYSDDPLRMMRAIRFASQLGFTIEEESFSSIKRNKERIEIISQERICDELNKIILSPIPSVGFYLLKDSGLLKIIFPQLEQLSGIEYIDGRGHKDNFVHTLQVLDNISEVTNDLWLRWAAILHDIAKPTTKRYDQKTGWTFHGHEFLGSKMVPHIFKALKLPLNEKMKYVQKLVLLHLRPIILAEDVTDSALRRLLFDASDDVDDLMTLCEADITSGNRKLVEQYNNNFKLVRQKLKDIEEKDELRNFQPPVSGETIMETFGLSPCREIGIIKNNIKEAILDGIISNNYTEAYNFMLEEGAKLGLIKKA